MGNGHFRIRSSDYYHVCMYNTIRYLYVCMYQYSY